MLANVFELVSEFCFLRLLCAGSHGENGFGLWITASTVDGALVKEGVETIIFFLGERVVFVIVAAAAVEGQAHPNGSDGFGHVEDVVDAVLFRDAAPLTIDGVIAEKAGGEFLLEGGVWKKVAGDLPDGEVIVGEVLVKGFDHPVAPGPHRAFAVSLKTIGVGVACRFEPRPGHALTEGRIGEVMFDKSAPGFIVGIGGEFFDFFGCWR